MKSKFKISALISLTLYIILNSVVFIQDAHYKSELAKFDLNQDGFFSKNETTPEQKKAMNLVIKDTGRKFAPILLIPICFIFGLIIFWILKIKASRKNRINSTSS